MNFKKQINNIFFIFAAISVITVLHYATSPTLPFLHDLYRRLYYLPIIYAAFRLGLRGGLITAGGVSLFFLPHIFHRWGQISSQTYDAIFEIILYFVIATITGILVELERKRRQELVTLREEMAELVCRCIQKPTIAKPAKAQGKPDYHFETMIGSSPAMLKIYDVITKGCHTADANVLISGESGTGKELVARAIHCYSTRKDNPFVAINCSAIPESLLESELFGYKKGAFTGADQDKPGKFELAHEGTLFLDEIGAMPVDLQSKLLRVIQDKEVHPVGAANSIKVDIRLISATNDDLEEKIKHKQFRADLFYRLHVVNIDLPSLRQRKEDIPLLVKHFLQKHGNTEMNLSEDALRKLQSYNWPGNIRELENVIHRAVTLNEGSLLLSDTLPQKIQTGEV